MAITKFYVDRKASGPIVGLLRLNHADQVQVFVEGSWHEAPELWEYISLGDYAEVSVAEALKLQGQLSRQSLSASA